MLYKVIAKYFLYSSRTDGKKDYHLYVIDMIEEAENYYVICSIGKPCVESNNGTTIELTSNDNCQRNGWSRWLPWVAEAIQDVEDGKLTPIFVAAVKGNTPNVINNDGRSTCFACDAPTKEVAGFTLLYNICTKCGK